MNCVVCSRADRAAIDTAILSATPDSKIADRFDNLAPIDVARHRAPYAGVSHVQQQTVESATANEESEAQWTPDLARVWFATMPHLVQLGRGKTVSEQAALLNRITPLLTEAVIEGQAVEFATQLEGLPSTTMFDTPPATPAARQDVVTAQSEVDRLLSLTPAGRETLRWRGEQRAKFSSTPRQIDPETRRLLGMTNLGRRTLKDADAGR